MNTEEENPLLEEDNERDEDTSALSEYVQSNDKDNSETSKPEGLPPIFSGVQAAIDFLATASSAYRTISSSWSPLVDAVKTAADNFSRIKKLIDIDAITNAVALIQQNISGFIQSLQIPSISEERRQELLDAYKTWGEFGWTLHPSDRVTVLLQMPPQTKKEADQKALQACKDTEQIFDALRSQKRAKIKDLEEAISDYKDKRYKSCALILFSLIDAQLIRFQRNKETQGNWREVGKKAVEKAKERIGIDEQTDLLISALYSANVFACLGKVFEGGKNFKKQPAIISRNFLDHGMLTRQVRKKDCLQLFLLYYNWTELMNYEYDKK